MALSEDSTTLNAYLADFGVSCTAGSVTADAILDQPSEDLIDGTIIFTDYLLTALNSSFGNLVSGDSITCDSVAYTVRETRKLDDGTFVEISLQKT
tara:strand:+ start:1208 stop:1495 length:288 start_codon:yes stop_codon:yes gene_type:complete